MAIDGVTTGYDPFYGIPRIGKIKKGEAGKLKDTDHFRFMLDKGYEHYQSTIQDLYFDDNGNPPSHFDDIIFLSDDIDLTFDNWYEQYRRDHILVRRCTGTHTVKLLQETGHYNFNPSPCIKDASNPCQCSMTGRLRFRLGRFTDKTKVFGYFELNTGSYYDLTHISNSLKSILSIHGSIVYPMIWTMNRADKEIPLPVFEGKGKSAKQTGIRMGKKNLISLQPNTQLSNAPQLLGGVSGNALASGALEIDRQRFYEYINGVAPHVTLDHIHTAFDSVDFVVTEREQAIAVLAYHQIFNGLVDDNPEGYIALLCINSDSLSVPDAMMIYEDLCRNNSE